MSYSEKNLPDAKRALRESFLETYAKKPYEQISIKELCEKAHVARTTFYFHYQNIAELKQELEDDLIDGLLHVADEAAGGDFEAMDFRQYVGNTLSYIQENREPIVTFLVRQPSYDFRSRWAREIEQHFQMQHPALKQRENGDLILHGLGAMILSVYEYWLLHPDRVDLSRADEDLMGILKGLGLRD